jgi:hypothetical protein
VSELRGDARDALRTPEQGPARAEGCRQCGKEFSPKYDTHRYCSQECGAAGPKPERRKVPRPSHETLLADLESMSFLAVGRKYGVSDNAVRKWLQ